MPTYSLPALPYAFNALEPHISATIMQLHHDKHHALYVKGANTAIEQLDDARAQGDFTRVAAVERALAFNLSGHILHSIFWTNLTPKGGGAPEGEFARAIARDFGTFDAFKHQLTEVAATIMGSGWGALIWEPLGGRLLTTQIYDHQSNLSQAGVPLMVIDAWEHAYYLQYKNEKKTYFEAIWNLWNWKDVSARFEQARKMDFPGTCSGTGGNKRVTNGEPSSMDRTRMP
jgi:Fe-Mn family superoxide dismutase